MQPHSILHFWFTELIPKQHFAKDAALDEAIRTRFGATLEAAARCELFAWRAAPEGRLAEVLVLDQFSRNVWRDTPRAFAGNSLLCRVALKGGAIDAASFTTVRLVSGAITLAALVWLQRKPSPQGARTTALPGGGLLYALASGALTSGLGYAVWYRVLPALQATHAATVQLSVPVIAAVGGVVLLGEAATWPMALSGCAILGGIGLVIWKKVQVPTPDRRPPTA